ncbi:MAG: xylulokinase [Clostridia bacterium]|nr:xylulokinase [Clostridia bacterium]
MKYHIGADLGTSSIKLLLCEKGGNIFATATENYPVAYPHPSWSEQNPDDWWSAFVKGIKSLTQGIDIKDVGGIAVAGQMHGLVVLNKEDKVIRPVILWNDGRTDKETEYLNTVIGKHRLSALTANIAFAGFTAPKLLWLRKNEPENFDRIEKIMLPKDYINYRLTGVHACDFSDASGMLLLDVKNKCWSKEMLDICGVSVGQMPQLFESYEQIGSLLPTVAEELGLPSGICVAAGAGDNAGAAIGTGTVGNNKCNISLGTSGTVFMSSDTFCVDEHNALHSFCHADGGYHLMGCILSAASCNKWFCEEVLIESDYEVLQNEIDEDMLGNNTVYFLPYLMGERSPINDTDASGSFIGLRPSTTRAQMILAVLEGVCFAIRDNIEIAKKIGINIGESTVCGGGARSKLWLTRLANVLNITICVPEAEEGPALGAALLAAFAAGESDSLIVCAKQEIKERIEPNAILADRYAQQYDRFREIYPRMKDLFKILKY